MTNNPAPDGDDRPHAIAIATSMAVPDTIAVPIRSWRCHFRRCSISPLFRVVAAIVLLVASGAAAAAGGASSSSTSATATVVKGDVGKDEPFGAAPSSVETAVRRIKRKRRKRRRRLPSPLPSTADAVGAAAVPTLSPPSLVGCDLEGGGLALKRPPEATAAGMGEMTISERGFGVAAASSTTTTAGVAAAAARVRKRKRRRRREATEGSPSSTAPTGTGRGADAGGIPPVDERLLHLATSPVKMTNPAAFVQPPPAPERIAQESSTSQSLEDGSTIATEEGDVRADDGEEEVLDLDEEEDFAASVSNAAAASAAAATTLSADGEGTIRSVPRELDDEAPAKSVTAKAVGEGSETPKRPKDAKKARNAPGRRKDGGGSVSKRTGPPPSRPTKPTASTATKSKKKSASSSSSTAIGGGKSGECLRRIKREWRDAVKLGIAYDWVRMETVSVRGRTVRRTTTVVASTAGSNNDGAQSPTNEKSSEGGQGTSSSSSSAAPSADQYDYVRIGPFGKNLLRWHFSVSGPTNSVYEKGVYHGRVILPRDYPGSPPRVQMLTPSGRFVPGADICLSASSYHPETWTPRWTILSLVDALRLHMLTTANEIGGVSASDEIRRKRAVESRSWHFTGVADHGRMVEAGIFSLPDDDNRDEAVDSAAPRSAKEDNAPAPKGGRQEVSRNKSANAVLGEQPPPQQKVTVATVALRVTVEIIKIPVRLVLLLIKFLCYLEWKLRKLDKEGD